MIHITLTHKATHLNEDYMMQRRIQFPLLLPSQQILSLQHFFPVQTSVNNREGSWRERLMSSVAFLIALLPLTREMIKNNVAKKNTRFILDRTKLHRCK